jgi:flagellar hook-basal body complex protein FliE
MAIEGIGKVGSIGPPAASGSKTVATGGTVQTFGESLMRLVESVESSGADANSAVSNMLDKTGDVHDAMIALLRAELSLQLTVLIRIKLVNAYLVILMMPV